MLLIFPKFQAKFRNISLQGLSAQTGLTGQPPVLPQEPLPASPCPSISCTPGHTPPSPARTAHPVIPACSCQALSSQQGTPVLLFLPGHALPSTPPSQVWIPKFIKLSQHCWVQNGVWTYTYNFDWLNSGKTVYLS